MQRVSVIGVTGSGKTRFAASLASRLHVPHVELDALHWEPNWTMVELDIFRGRVASQVSADGWVIDGNYAKVRDLVWGRADTVVWLDYSFALTFARLLRRTLARIRSGEELWNGNRERFAEQFFSRESLLIVGDQDLPEVPCHVSDAPGERRLQPPARGPVTGTARHSGMAGQPLSRRMRRRRHIGPKTLG